MTVTVHPEFLSRREDVAVDPERAWTLRPARVGEVGASDVATKTVVAPTGRDPRSRLLRQRELLRVRVSPPVEHANPWVDSYEDWMVAAAEEFRLNVLLARSGRDVSVIATGGEAALGIEMANSGDMPGLLAMTARLAPTTAFGPFVDAVASVDFSLAESLMSVATGLLRSVVEVPNEFLASTVPEMTAGVTVPRGFYTYTEYCASILRGYHNALAGRGAGAGVAMADTLDPDDLDALLQPSMTDSAARFARMVLDEDVVLDARLPGKLGRKKVAADVGRNPRRITRMLTDPHRKVFDRYTRGLGGVVLIDQSGSMRLSEADVWSLVSVAPGCVIIGYSHKPYAEDVPNVWVLANRGRVASHVRHGNTGNGVDGPALLFAQSMRRTGEPFLWICDGDVTNYADDVQSELAEVCARFVTKYGIHMVGDVDDALDALHRAAAGERLHARGVGYVGLYVDNLTRDR